MSTLSAEQVDDRRWQPLTGRRPVLRSEGWAADYAAILLESLGAEVRHAPERADPHPAIAWARSGGMALTGRADGQARMCPAPIASCLDGALLALGSLAGEHVSSIALLNASLLGERAAMTGLKRSGSISAGGSCRLLPTADGWLALSLARDEDWQLLPAWLEGPAIADWHALARLLATRETTNLVDRGRLLGLALAPLDTGVKRPARWQNVVLHGESSRRRHDPPLAIDLSCLWAGPLCGQLLRTLGARVIKLESRQRPDGARQGASRFFSRLNAGKQSVVLDLSADEGRGQLHDLLRAADIVIESSRPRALRQLGIDAETLLADRPGLTWISITGHGRAEPEAGWIAYGDDAGVAAGLSAELMQLTGEPLFCGDAIGDPLTGAHAALAAWSAHLGGGGVLLSLSLAETVRHCRQFRVPASAQVLHERQVSWQALAEAAGLAEYRVPNVAHSTDARPLGADTAAVLREFVERC